MAFRNWLEQEIRRAEKQVRETRQGSGEWLMAIHQLEVLDECFMQYTRGDRIVDERLLKKSQPLRRPKWETPAPRLQQNFSTSLSTPGSDRYWVAVIVVFFLVVGAGVSLNFILSNDKLLSTLEPPPIHTLIPELERILFGDKPESVKPGAIKSEKAVPQKPKVFESPGWEDTVEILDSSDPNSPEGIFLARLDQRIRQNWTRPTGAGENWVVVDFLINDKGLVTATAIIASSGNPEFDKAAVRAIESGEPYRPAPLPGEKKQTRVRYTFD